MSIPEFPEIFLDKETLASLEKGGILVPHAPVLSCPIEASLGLFGKKWTLVILRDISMRKKERFNELLKSLPGISPRVLSRRLRELESSGLISHNANGSPLQKGLWKITEKGWDALPILFSYVAFGSKWYADIVFADSKPRSMKEQYPSETAEQFFINLEVNKELGQTRTLGNRPVRKAARW